MQVQDLSDIMPGGSREPPSSSEKIHRIMQERFSGKRLIVASNRGPYIHRRAGKEVHCELAMGGLVAALDPVMQTVGGSWVAWGSGDADRMVVDDHDRIQVPPEHPSYTLRRVWLTEEEVDGFYSGYSNGFIWPLCHLALDRMVFKKRDWETYREVNRRFAQTVLEEAADTTALVWIQDYHLALCPQIIKRMQPDLSVSLFWHIPWPPHDVFRVCPQRRELLEGMLGCDLIGFHVEPYRDNFLHCAERELGAAVDWEKGLIEYQGRRTAVQAFPISVDYTLFHSLAQAPYTPRGPSELRKRFNLSEDHRIGLGVDRLDYTKGLLKRLAALDQFFARYPEYHKRFSFIQIGVPTREESKPYRRYRELIHIMVAEINGKYGREGWKPIQNLEGQLSQKTLASYYREADLCIVSSVYDGMNLVAKEFVASQVDQGGVLLLSEMAGAAQEMEDALLINPYDSEGFADTIKEALELPLEVRREKMRRMRKWVQEHDIYYWMESVLKAVVDAGPSL